MADLTAAVLSEPPADGTCRHCWWAREPYVDPPAVCNACAHDIAVCVATDLRVCALALLAVAENNRRLRAAEAQRARDAALVASYEYGKRTGGVMMELRAAERQVLTLEEQLAVAHDDARADREALARYRELHDADALQRGVLAARLDMLAASGSIYGGARRILDEVRAALRSLPGAKEHT